MAERVGFGLSGALKTSNLLTLKITEIPGIEGSEAQTSTNLSRLVAISVPLKPRNKARTNDTFYLDGAAHRLDSLLDRLHAQDQFTFVPGKTHFDLYQKGDDRFALMDRIIAEMCTVARPQSAS
jgi:hypothetical protein